MSGLFADAYHSFELGGEKKTKGAALTFVCRTFFCDAQMFTCHVSSNWSAYEPYVASGVHFNLPNMITHAPNSTYTMSIFCLWPN